MHDVLPPELLRKMHAHSLAHAYGAAFDNLAQIGGLASASELLRHGLCMPSHRHRRLRLAN
jgi:hypothetical protein